MTSETIVHIIDDDDAVRDSLAFLLESADMAVRTYESAVRFLEQSSGLERGCIVTDVRMPDMGGIDALLAIRTQFADARVIMLTTFEGDAEIQRALAAGAQGYMLKSMPRKQLVETIRKVHAGHKHIPPEVAAQLMEHLLGETLSKREVEVLQKVAGGNRNSEIAALLFVSEETVKGHIKHIMEKLGASDRTEAVSIGIRRGIIHL